ncbi:MAG: hypothetical protein PHW86_04915 [Candidatus Bipolaricaulis sp.]|nr:hypothetical protein [Candidatus Bipolaricaulis sp.]
MRRVVSTALVLVALVAACASLGGAAEPVGFGFGGGGVMAFFPDLVGINAYLSENGLGPLDEGFLIGGGGGGRGGVIGGPVFGGMGFGVMADSEAMDRIAELVVGAGGFDVGYAVGGSERSVLTIGVVLGGGAAVLDLTTWGAAPAEAGRGIVPVPTEVRTIGRAFGFVLPYVSLEAQILPFMGIEVRIGYLIPVIGADFGDVVGVPVPSLDLSGPSVGFSLVFGGIAGGDRGGAKTATSRGSIDLGDAARFSLEGGIGTIRITSYAAGETQTSSGRVLEWEAVRNAARSRDVDALTVDVAQVATGIEMRSAGNGNIDYAIRVPAGMDLEVSNGTGRVEFAACTAGEIAVSLGTGEILLTDVRAATVTASAGVGWVYLLYPQVNALTVDVGMGAIELVLLPEVSATIAATVGMGDLTIAGFPEAAGTPRGAIGKTLDAVLGGGAARIILNAGLGEIRIGSAP